MAKRIIFSFGKAILMVIALNILQFLFSFLIPLFFGKPAEEGTVASLNFLFGLSVIPVALACFLLKDHLMNGIVWTLTLLLYYLLLGVGNGNLQLLFSAFFIYVLIFSPLIINIALLYISKNKKEVTPMSK